MKGKKKSWVQEEKEKEVYKWRLREDTCSERRVEKQKLVINTRYSIVRVLDAWQTKEAKVALFPYSWIGLFWKNFPFTSIILISLFWCQTLSRSLPLPCSHSHTHNTIINISPSSPKHPPSHSYLLSSFDPLCLPTW